MTCRSARRHFPDLFETGENPDLREHLAACGVCAAEFEESISALAVIRPPARMAASPDFKRRTLRRLAEFSRPATAPPRRFPLFATAAAALALLLALPYFSGIGTNRAATALLAQSVQALNAVRSVHITARMRTLPGDNFEFIGAQYDFQPVEMWKEFAPSLRWRLENPGRIVVVDGEHSTLFVKPDRVVHAGRNAGFVEWLRPLLDPERVLASELRAAQKAESRAVLRQDGPRVILTTTRKAQGDFGNDWARDTSIDESDHTRIYQFDAATGRLTGLQVMLHDGTVVFEITSILYNETLPPELFTITLPDKVITDVPPEQMPLHGALAGTAREAAVAFLQGMADRDWDRVLTVYPVTGIPDGLKRYGGGLEILSIGEPFQSGLYAGWFVPYEIRLADGTHKKWNLAVRNDNPQHRWLQDGGF